MKQLKKQTKELNSYHGRIEHLFSQPKLFDSKALKKGDLYYEKSNGKSKLRINFETLKQDDEKEQKYPEHFIFDGIWLTRIDYQVKKTERRQLTEPNKPADPFELASREFPIIGFTKIEELKKQFEINLVQPVQTLTSSADSTQAEGYEKDEPKTSFHLHLKIKPDSIYKDDYTSIDFWVDKKSDLPVKIIAITTEDDIYEIKFLKPAVNKKIDEKIFKFDIPQNFTMEIIPLKSKESEEK